MLAGLGVVVLIVAVVAGILVLGSGSSSGPAPVAGQLLFNNSLASSSGVKLTSPSFNSSGSASFTGGRLKVTSKNPNGIYEVLPNFRATSSQLASLRAGVDVYLSNGQAQAGLAWRNQSDGSRYVFLITRDGSFQIFKSSAGNGTQLLTGSVDASDHYRLVIAGTGPVNPGPHDTVNLSFRINSNSFSQPDPSGALASGGIGMEVDGAGSAEFANLSVAHQ